MKATYQKHLSEDLVQEVFLRLLKFRGSYKGEGLFSTWVYRIAHNVLYDHYRKKPKGKMIEEVVELIQDDTDIHENLENSENIRILNEAFKQLKESERELITLKRYQNMKYKEIAAIQNIAVGTVKSKVHTAIASLKDKFIELSSEER